MQFSQESRLTLGRAIGSYPARYIAPPTFFSLLQCGMQCLDLVTREEFAILERSRERLEALKVRVPASSRSIQTIGSGGALYLVKRAEASGPAWHS